MIRVIRWITGIILIVVAFWLILLTAGCDFIYNGSISFIQWLRYNHLQSILIAIGFLLTSIFIILINKQVSYDNYFVNRFRDGELRIADKAVEDIILTSIAEVTYFKVTKCGIRQINNELEISIYFYPNSKHNCDIMLKIQDKIRNNVENYSGLKVSEVKMLIQPPRFYWLSTLRRWV